MFLRMVARPLMVKVKQTTGIKKVPEDVVPNSREVLIGLYNQILNETKKFPEYLTYREHVEIDTNLKLKICQKVEDLESIPKRHFPHSRVEEIIEEARHQLNEVSGLLADWHSWIYRPHPLPPHPYVNKRGTLKQLYEKALKVVRTVPENNKLRMFAESSITSKLKVWREERDWESLRRKLDYVDPIQKAREELDHWSAFFGPDAYPNRKFPLFLRTKEFCERFNAWQGHVSPEISKSRLIDECFMRSLEDKVSSN